MKMTVRRELLADTVAELEPVVARAMAEIGRPGMTPGVDWPRLAALEAAGKTLLLVLRAEGAIVGYVLMIIDRHIHYAETVAVNDALFIDRAHRARWAARLVRYTEVACRVRGASHIHWHAKAANALGPMLERLGYAPLETVLGKSLGRAA